MSRIGVNWGLGGSSKVEWPVVDRRWLLIWGFYVFQLRLGGSEGSRWSEAWRLRVADAVGNGFLQGISTVESLRRDLSGWPC